MKKRAFKWLLLIPAQLMIYLLSFNSARQYNDNVMYEHPTIPFLKLIVSDGMLILTILVVVFSIYKTIAEYRKLSDYDTILKLLGENSDASDSKEAELSVPLNKVRRYYYAEFAIVIILSLCALLRSYPIGIILLIIGSAEALHTILRLDNLSKKISVTAKSVIIDDKEFSFKKADRIRLSEKTGFMSWLTNCIYLEITEDKHTGRYCFGPAGMLGRKNYISLASCLGISSKACDTDFKLGNQ